MPHHPTRNRRIHHAWHGPRYRHLRQAALLLELQSAPDDRPRDEGVRGERALRRPAATSVA